MKLSDYLRDEKITEEEFAARGGKRFSAEAVRKWRYGVRVPRPDHIALIAELTGNAVTADDLLAGYRATNEQRRDKAVRVA